MALDLATLIQPETTAVVVFECQEALLGEASPLPGLARAAKEAALLPRLATLLDQARNRGVRVIYVTAVQRPDGVDQPINTPLEQRIREAGGKFFEAGPICAEVAPQDNDVVLERRQGMTGFYKSGLDVALRKFGVRSIVLTGISLNIGVFGTTIEAVNHGYTVVIPRDCVAADPPGYGDAVLRYSLRNLAFLSDSDELAELWAAGSE